ncbi:MAG: N-acetylneuraminate synthase family protein [Patescibacteria group bacterium]
MSDVFIVAEIGKNFIQAPEEESVLEYLAKAKALVDAAVETGVDAVKFQTHEIEDEQLDSAVISPHFPAAERYAWVKRNTRITPLEDFWRPLKAHCDSRGIIFFSTPMSRAAAQKLEPLNVPMWKVGSGDVLDYVLLDYLASTGKPIIISTGMISLSELDQTVSYLRSKQAPLSILYCVSEYPCPTEKFNLATIEYLKERYPEMTIGFSDHSLGDQAALAAVKLGAAIIEKHFSFAREFWGADHKVSMLPKEMKRLVFAIRNGEYQQVNHRPFYGEKARELDGAQNQFRPYFHRSLVAGADLPAGVILTRELIYSLRPQSYLGGLSADQFELALGRRLKRSLKKYETIKKENLA